MAGLLDSLFGSGSDANKGLLDFLRGNAMNQQMPSGLASDTAQYAQQPAAPVFAPPPSAATPQSNPQPSPMDRAQWLTGPVGAPSQANAQMQPPVPQQPPAVIPASPVPDAGPGIGDRLGASLQSFANSGGPLPALANGLTSLFTGQRSDPTGVAQQQAAQTANVTARALLAKGVDPQVVAAAVAPGNTEMLKTLVDANFKPKDPLNMGGGYILRPGAAKAERLFEPDEKTPAGFATDDKGMHFVPGGPADPAYLRLKEAQSADPNAVHVLGRGGELYKVDEKGVPTVVHKNEQEDGVPLTDDAKRLLADRVIAADSTALRNLGRGMQGRRDLVDINNIVAEKLKDNPNAAKQILQNAAQQAGLVSSSRALGTKETHFGVAEKAMEESIPLAQAASDAVPRSEWMHINQLIQAGSREHSNPALKRFLIANDTAVKDYARTINPTGALRESDIEYARKTLSTADGPEAYTAGLNQLQQEAGVMHRAIQRQKAELQGGAGAPPAITGKTKSGVSWGLVR